MARPQKFRLSPDDVLVPENARKLAGHVSEIEFFRAEVEKLQAQIAGIYDAADDDGFDKKFVRKAVARRAKAGPAFEAEENSVECYVEAVEKGLPTRTREKNSDDTSPDHDPLTGELHDHEPLPPDPAAQEAGDHLFAVGRSSGRTEPSADGQRTHESPSINDEASSTAAPQGEAVHSQGTGAETLAGREGRSEGQAASVDLPTLSPTTATEPGTEAAGAPAIAEDASRQERSAGTTFDVRSLRPHCLHPDCCGSSGRDHCWSCRKAMKASEVTA